MGTKLWFARLLKTNLQLALSIQAFFLNLNYSGISGVEKVKLSRSQDES